MNNDQIATLTRRYHEIYRLLMEGTIPVEPVLAGFQKLAEGNFGSKVVDLDADPFVPNGWSVEGHTKGGKLDFDPAKITLYLSKGQEGGKRIEGDKLREELKARPVFNANLLDFLLKKENQHLIPESWKGQYVFFWGTIYRYSGGGLCVRCLYWDDGGWYWSCRWIGDVWYSGSPAAVSAS